MTMVFEITRPAPVGLVSISIRNPEFGDNHSFPRRQAKGTTEGGRQFVEDLGVDEEFFLGTWTNLNRCERRDLTYFFSDKGANKRERPFTLRVVDNANLAFPIGTGQGWNTSADLNSGLLLVPTSASFGLVRLDQSELAFTSIPRDRYTTSLRFRILLPPAC